MRVHYITREIGIRRELNLPCILWEWGFSLTGVVRGLQWKEIRQNMDWVTGLMARSLHCIGVVTELNRPKEHWRYWSNHKILILWLDIKADIQCYFMNISREYTHLASLTFILMLVSRVQLITWINLSCIPVVMMSQRFCFALFFGS